MNPTSQSSDKSLAPPNSGATDSLWAAILVALANFGVEWDRRNRETDRLAQEEQRRSEDQARAENERAEADRRRSEDQARSRG